MLEKIKETVEFIQSKLEFNPEVGIILGTGLGGLTKEINIEFEIEYKDIPNFPVSTVEGHRGALIFGEFAGKKVIAMQGRFHYYEGYTMQETTFPVRVLKLLGIELLIVSNASGGMNPDFSVGDIMVINDHINLFGTSPLIGKNISELGPRFPDMSEAYDKKLIAKALEIGNKLNIKLRKGIYAGVTGPTFETPAEYFYIRSTGADAVGMSTVPEVIVARHMNMTCFALSVITDSGVPGEIVEVSHEEVQEVASKAESKMALVIAELLKSI
ncbi:MAG: purine-nucleoside phosphorylase [Bacteroidetes bacterium]|nr:MAG: purine-nucleoside phosphorylase [Bacteroidota bacterium]